MMYKNQQQVVNNCMEDDIFNDDSIDELISQLKENDTIVKQAEKIKVDKDNLEEFILNSSSELIQDSLEIISNVKQYTAGAPDARESTSLAELIKAASGAIDTLNKVLIQDKRKEAQVEVKQMDIEMKQGLAKADATTKLLLSREDILNKLIDDAETVDVETVDAEILDDPE